MKVFASLVFCLFALSNSAWGQTIPFQIAYTYQAGSFNSLAARHVSFDPAVQQLYAVNPSNLTFSIQDYTDIFKPNTLKIIDVSSFMSSIRSVESSTGYIFVCGDGNSQQSSGKLLIYDDKGNYQKQLNLGAAPKYMKFTPDGITLIIANEGVPDSSYATDPQGSVNLLNISSGISQITQNDIKTIDFTLLDTTAYDPLIHVYGNNGLALPSQDLEPEAIGIKSDNLKAFVVLQENNALAVIDINSASLDEVIGLGYRDYSLSGLDASDAANSININTYPRLFGMHQPGDIAMFNHQGEEFAVTANRGARRQYAGYDETTLIKNQPVDPTKFNNIADLQQDTVLGRLQITQAYGDYTGDGLHDSLLSFGSRSISIWDSTGGEIWNSGDEIAQTLKLLHAANFNASAISNSSYKQQSDDLGAEPSAVAIGEVDGKRYLFVSLYQMGGLIVYDISNPASPVFELFDLPRNFTVSASDPNAGDLGPSDLEFVPANRTTLGIALLFVVNEVSGTISVYQAGMGIGLQEITNKDLNGVYPNPSEGVFYPTRFGTFQVFNQAGQLIRTAERTTEIDLTDQPKGMYLIKAEDGSSIRVIKN